MPSNLDTHIHTHTHTQEGAFKCTTIFQACLQLAFISSVSLSLSLQPSICRPLQDFLCDAIIIIMCACRHFCLSLSLSLSLYLSIYLPIYLPTYLPI
jgi:hypothetical protein